MMTTPYCDVHHDYYLAETGCKDCRIAELEAQVSTMFTHEQMTLVGVALSKEVFKIAELEAKLENARIAAAETQPTWKHRCYAILSALDGEGSWGDPDLMMPDEQKKHTALEDKLRGLPRYCSRKEEQWVTEGMSVVHSPHQNGDWVYYRDVIALLGKEGEE